MKNIRPLVFTCLTLVFLGSLALADKYDERLKDLKTKVEKGTMGKSDYELGMREVLEEQVTMKSFEACILNLKLIDGAKKTWGIEQKKAAEDAPADGDLFGPDKPLRAKPVCLAGGTYTLGALSGQPTCSVKGHDLSVVAKWEAVATVLNQRVCLRNLRLLARAKDQWAADNKNAAATALTLQALVANDKYLTEKTACPSGGTYILGKGAEDPTCSVEGHSLKAREFMGDWPVDALPEAVQKILLKNQGQRNACINNLRQWDGAKEQWALENRRTANDTPEYWDIIGTDKYIKVLPACPAGGSYLLNDMSHKPQCTTPGHKLM